MIEIRLARTSDTEGMLDIYRPIIEHTATSFEYEVPDLVEFQSRVSKILASHPWLVCDYNQAIAGYAYASPHRSREAYQWSIELSVYVNPAFQRRGVAKALYQALMSVLKVQGFHNALAGITLPNATSVSFHESLGFTPVGVYKNVGFKFNRWQSVGWWEMPLKSLDEQPDKPLILSKVFPSDELTKIMRSAALLVK